MKVLSMFSGFMLILASGLSAAAPSLPANYIEGQDFVVLTEPIRTINPSKIEVTEAFAYPCHACFNFEPILEPWVKSQAADVVFLRSHVTFHPEWEPYQRGYYTVLSLNLKKNIDMDIFNEIHVKQNELSNAQEWADFLANHGVDKQKVISAYNSFAVGSQMKQADARNIGYKITSTPTLVIDGKYKVSSGKNSYEDVLKVAQFLIEKSRSEKNSTVKASQ